MDVRPGHQGGKFYVHIFIVYVVYICDIYVHICSAIRLPAFVAAFSIVRYI